MRGVVLFSGGLDSFATAVIAARECEAVYLLHLWYPRPNEQEELNAARRGAERLGLPLRAEPMPRFADYQGDVLPGRNLILLALAASYAASVEAGAVYIGACGADGAGFPDCRPAFLQAAEAAIGVGMGGVVVKAPLVNKTKAETFALLAEGGRLGDALALTRTCYRAGPSCGECSACKTRAAGWAEFNA